jgi:mannose-1-phosphate guanylyltransferase
MRWCIVVADDHGPEWAPSTKTGERPSPVQYSCLGGQSTLLQRALSRAGRIAPAARILVTALEEYREYWEPALWHIRAANRYVCDNRAASLLTGAAALLSVAAVSPSSIVTILPARCHVSREWILQRAIDHVTSLLPCIREGVATLGMMDIDEGIDEDYLIAGPAGPGFTVQGFARRPTAWVARHLKRQGAMVSSGIMIGYAGAFAAHITKHWPGLTLKLSRLAAAAAMAGEECELPLSLQTGVPKPVLQSLRWNPPAFAQRAFCVHSSGWSGLKSPRAAERISAFLAANAGLVGAA